MPECVLEKELNKCHYYKEGLCTSDKQCSFQKKVEKKLDKKEYVRKERWFEKYYRK